MVSVDPISVPRIPLKIKGSRRVNYVEVVIAPVWVPGSDHGICR